MSANPTPVPPRLATHLAALALHESIREAYLGDLEETFRAIHDEKGARAARRWYWRQAVSVPFGLRTAPQLPWEPPTRRAASFIESFAEDVRLAGRGIAHRPGFAALFVLTTSLGIGASTVIFSAAKPILFTPVPYSDPDRIVRIKQSSPRGEDSRIGFMTVADLRDRSRSFSAIALIGSWQAIVQEGGEPTLFKGIRVSPEYFSVLGVRPAIGRDFRAEDDVPNSDRTAILSHRVWRERFASDSSIVHRTIRINDFPYRVVGVMPDGFEDVIEPGAAFWRPLQYSRTSGPSCRTCQHLTALGRLKPDVDARAAAAEVNGIFASLGKEFPSEYPKDLGGVTVRLGNELTAGARPAMIAALAGVFLVLLIGCVNATNLLLGRGIERRPELAVRVALGADRSRLIRQLVVESMLLSSIGGVVGIATAAAGLTVLRAAAPSSLPRVSAMQLDLTVLVVSLTVTFIAGLVFGLLPAIETTSGGMTNGIRLASQRTVGRSGRMRSGLVIAEMALAVMVLLSSGLLLRSVRHVLGVEPGFEPRHVLAMQIVPVGQRFNSNDTLWQYYRRVTDLVRTIPGVDDAAFTSQLPLSSDFDQSGIHSERHPRANPADDPSAHRYGVTPGYLEAMSIPVIRGRTIRESDDGPAGDSIALVNERFARAMFPGEDPIGQRIRVGPHDKGPWRVIVGLTGDLHQVSLSGGESDAVYLPERQQQFADGPIWLVVHSSLTADAIGPVVRAAVRRVDPTQPIVKMGSMESIVESSAASRRFILALFEIFAVLSGLLAALGLYGVLSASVSERLREIGLRGALGATPADIIRLVVGRAASLAIVGAGAGLIASMMTTRFIADQLFETSRGDPATHLAVLGMLSLLVLASSALPALRAARVDPMESLRSD